jgi:hypothetical protein
VCVSETVSLHAQVDAVMDIMLMTWSRSIDNSTFCGATKLQFRPPLDYSHVLLFTLPLHKTQTLHHPCTQPGGSSFAFAFACPRNNGSHISRLKYYHAHNLIPDKYPSQLVSPSIARASRQTQTRRFLQGRYLSSSRISSPFLFPYE